MKFNTYRIRLLNEDQLQALGKTEWHKDISANSLPYAWGKFVAQKFAPALPFGSESPVADDYDIHFESIR